MFKTLLLKQLTEAFKVHFVNPKTGKELSKKGSIISITVFISIIWVMFIGLSVFLSILLGKGLIYANLGYLYFLVLTGMALVVGVFGSMFSTYSSLYLSKDNDLLLSLPIPVKYIVISRLLVVYLWGAFYSLPMIIPTIVIYWIFAGITFTNFIGGIVLILIITLITFVLSCILGFVVAKIASKIKSRNFVTVLASLCFLGLYYIAYFKVSDIIKDIMSNATSYGEAIKGSAYLVYLFGDIGCGNLLSALGYSAVIIALLALTYWIISSTFIKITIQTEKRKESNKTAKASKEKGIVKTLISKELSKFFSSANYILNCGMGFIILIIFGVILLTKGSDIMTSFVGLENAVHLNPLILLITIAFSCISMIFTSTPSFSLEGKNLWILKSLPIETKHIIRAKFLTQIIICIIPTTFVLISILIKSNLTLSEILLTIGLTYTFLFFITLYDTFLGLSMPIFNWTNEIVPIKQSASVMLALFGGWAIGIAFVGFYLLFGYIIGLLLYISMWILIFAILSIILLLWFKNKGRKLFNVLSN